MCCRSSWRPKQKFSGKPWVHKPRYLNQLLVPRRADIQPLLENLGIGAGDIVELRLTKVTCADQALLAAKGVEVRTELFSACG